jgi:hypothetical protein
LKASPTAARLLGAAGLLWQTSNALRLHAYSFADGQSLHGGKSSTRLLIGVEPNPIADVPTSIRLLRLRLGRAGLLDSSKIAIVQAPDDEVPTIPGVVFYGWVSQIAGKVVRDRRRRPVIKLTKDALRSSESAVKTVGHELHHLGEMLAGSGADERAAEDAAEAYWAAFVKRSRKLK